MKERIFQYVFLITGLSMLLYLAPKEYYISRKLVKTGIKTEGTVVVIVPSRTERNANGHTRKPKYAIFHYIDQSNKVNKYERKKFSIFDRYKLGDVVDLVYDPATKVTRPYSFHGLYSLPILMIFVGSLFTLLGVAVGRSR